MLTRSAYWSISETFAGGWATSTTGWRLELPRLAQTGAEPELQGLDKELTFRVEQLDEKADPEEWPELFRSLSLNCA